MDNHETLYDVLEVSRTASPDEIKKAFHTLAQQYHTDKNHNATDRVKKLAEDKFKEITEAYTVLRDPYKKRQYDSKLKEFEERNKPKNTYKTSTKSTSSSQKTASPPKSNPTQWSAAKTLKVASLVGAVSLFIFYSAASSSESPSMATDSTNTSYSVTHPTETAFSKTQNTKSGIQTSETGGTKKASSQSPAAITDPLESCQAVHGQYSYASSTGSCSCFNGYQMDSSNTCVSNNDYCSSQYSNSTWDSNSNSCSCSSGYTWNTAHTSCISQSASYDNICKNTYGTASVYAGQTNAQGGPTCDCPNGASWNSDKTGCFSNEQSDQSCQQTYQNTYFSGKKSTDGKNICDCKSGYYWDKNKTGCYSQSAYNQQCESSYGQGSSYSTYSNSCSCDYGYTWSSATNWCVKNQ